MERSAQPRLEDRHGLFDTGESDEGVIEIFVRVRRPLRLVLLLVWFRLAPSSPFPLTSSADVVVVLRIEDRCE